MTETTDEIPTPKKAKKRSKKLVIAIACGIVVLGCGVGVGVYASGSKGEAGHEDPRRPKLVLREEHPAESGEAGHGEEKAIPRRVGTIAVAKEGLPIDPRKFEVAYYPIEQNFTANLADGSGFVQIGISLATYYDSRVGDNIARQMVPIRSAILMVLSDQHAGIISTPEGKQQLQRLLTRSINQTLKNNEGFGGIDNVYFTSLVLQ